MEDKLRLNTKFLDGFNGVIGRRDFFLNFYVYINSLVILSTYPYILWMYKNVGSLNELANFMNIFLNTPLGLKLWMILTTILICIPAVSNIARRLNDINGKISPITNSLSTVSVVVSLFWFVFPLSVVLLVSVFNFVLFILLLFKKGKITSKFPHDFLKQFNWGAFLGTWIWGLINASYKTLWYLILAYTPWGFNYALYCGLKGNEWAYKNRHSDTDEEFNKKQKKQSIIFAVIFLIIIPLIYFLLVGFFLVLLFSFMPGSSLKTDLDGNKTQVEQLENGFDSFFEKTVKLYFVSYKITPTKNIFYVESADWKQYDFQKKVDILDFAASYAANKKTQASKKKSGSNYEYYSKSSELSITKIYSAENNKLLAEFSMRGLDYRKASFFDVMKASTNAYRFYNP